MNRYISIVLIFLLCTLLTSQIQAQPEAVSGTDKKTGVPKITITGLDANNVTLGLSYEIRNKSEDDIWILVGYGKTSVSAEVFMDEDSRTLLVRRRLNVPFSGGNGPIYGRYVLLRAGQTQTESVSLAIPVRPERVFAVGRQARGLEYASRLAIEIGYYVGNLPGTIRGILEKADKIGNKFKNRDEELNKAWFKGSLHFNKINEILKQRDEEILLPYTYQWFKGEQILRTTVDGLHIPYEEEDIWATPNPYLPGLPSCTRVEIQCQPSILEYFFPYAGQQSLLSPVERQELRSLRTIVIDGGRLIALGREVNEGGVYIIGKIVCQRSMAKVVCYHDSSRLASFTIYNDESIITGRRYRFTYDGFQSLRMLTPQIKPLELRVKCAANLRNLWHRMRLYYKVDKKRRVDSSGKSEILYPAPANWCDAIVQACRTIDMLNEDIIRPFICPGTDDSKRHLAKSYYSMNPDCKYDSARDTVLLFETKAGWNQHGGPELFSFINHDPKGGCVLLNDGTVKFIRTKEELQQLRWK